MTNAELLEFMRAGGAVKRYHTQPHLSGRQDIAQHSFGMAMLILTFNTHASLELLSAALTHDMGEQFVADVPSPVKWANPWLAEELNSMEKEAAQKCGWQCERLSDEEEEWLEVCDKLEGVLFCYDELAQGNFGAIVVAERFINAIRSSSIKSPQLHELVLDVIRLWEFTLTQILPR